MNRVNNTGYYNGNKIYCNTGKCKQKSINRNVTNVKLCCYKIMAESHSPPRSRNNDVPSYVTFFNRSDRTVNLFWINYEGKLVRYGRIPPFKGTSMNTYVTHPWIVRDANTGYPLLLNGKSVFHPTADTHEGSRMMIWIHIPGKSHP